MFEGPGKRRFGGWEKELQFPSQTTGFDYFQRSVMAKFIRMLLLGIFTASLGNINTEILWKYSVY